MICFINVLSIGKVLGSQTLLIVRLLLLGLRLVIFVFGIILQPSTYMIKFKLYYKPITKPVQGPSLLSLSLSCGPASATWLPSPRALDNWGIAALDEVQHTRLLLAHVMVMDRWAVITLGS